MNLLQTRLGEHATELLLRIRKIFTRNRSTKNELSLLLHIYYWNTLLNITSILPFGYNLSRFALHV